MIPIQSTRTDNKSISKSTLLIIIFIIIGLSIYYINTWKNLDGFVKNIDHCNLIFCDFVNHYYPMGVELFQRHAPVDGYFYSAFFAIPLVGLSKFSLNYAITIWWIFQILVILLLCILPLRRSLNLSPNKTILYILFFGISIPIFHNLKWGQISVFLTLCIIATYIAHKDQKYILAGVILALATSIKYYPGVFILYFLFQKSWRTIITFCICMLLFFVITPILFMGTEHWFVFQIEAFNAATDADWVERDKNSQYFVHKLNRLFDNSSAYLSLLKVIGVMIAGVNIFLVRQLQSFSEKLPSNIFNHWNILSYCLLLLTIPFVVKTSWPHYFVYLPFCQIAIIQSTSIIPKVHLGQRYKFVLYSIVILSVIFSSTLYFNTFIDWDVYTSQGWLLWSNILLMLIIYILSIGRQFFIPPTSEPVQSI